MRMRKERSVEVVKVCTKNIFIHHHHPIHALFLFVCCGREFVKF